MLPNTAGIGRLVRWNSAKKLAYVRTLSVELSTEASGRVGQIQGLIGAELPAKTGDALVAHIEDALENGIEEAIRKMPVTADHETVFETAVSKVNHALSRLLSDRGLVVPAEGVNGVLLAQQGKSAVAAVWGEPSVLLVRRKTPGNVRIFDVLAGSDEGRPRTGTRRGFTNLIAGTLSSKDLMVVANRDVTELLEMDALADILSHGTPDAVTAQLTDALTSRHDDLSLALLLLEGVPEPSTETAKPAARDPRRSRVAPPTARPAPGKTEAAVVEPKPGQALRSMTGAASAASSKAAEALGEMFAKGKKAAEDALEQRKAKKAAAAVARAERPAEAPKVATAASQQVEAPNEPARPSQHDEIAAVDRRIVEALHRGAAAPAAEAVSPAVTETPDRHADLRETVAHAADTAKNVAHSIADLGSKEGRERIRRLSRERTDRFFDRLIDWFNDLPAQRRWLLIAALSLILFLNVSVGVAGVQRFRERAVAEYERQLTVIDQKVDSAEASMIYRDEDRARRLLDEASAVVAALPEKTEEQQAKKDELAGVVAAKLDGLRRAVGLPAPEVAAAVATESGSPVLTRLAAYAGVLWATDATGNVYRIDDGEAAKVGDGPVKDDIFVPTRDGVLAGAPTDGLTLVKASGSGSVLSLDTGEMEVAVNDATTFGSRLYLLDAAHNRILRHPAVVGGYAAPEMYVKDATDLSSAVSFAIDGYIYVLSKDGKVTRLLRGDRTDFSVSTVDPAVTSALRLRTDAEDGDLYVLDGSPARIIRFDKDTGKLVAQYESEHLAGATDFVVDEANRSFLVLDGNQVLRFSFEETEE